MALKIDNLYINFKEYSITRKNKPKEIKKEIKVTEENKDIYPYREVGETIIDVTYDNENIEDKIEIKLTPRICNPSNPKEEFTNGDMIRMDIDYTGELTDERIYNELKKQKIKYRNMFEKEVELDLSKAEDV